MDDRHAVYSIFQNPFAPRFERLVRRRARHTSPRQFYGYLAGGLVDVMENNVAVVGLDGRTDHLDDRLYPGT